MPQTPSFSLEFFPPKTPEGEAQLWEAMTAYADLAPAYMTVTYGAGGSTKDGTLSTLRQAVKTFPAIAFASHLTFLSTTRRNLDIYLEQLWDAGVQKIVALRGDLPKGTQHSDFTGPEYFQWTSDFVEHIKAYHPFKVIVGAYPEKHPDAPSMAADIEALRKKCAAGADSATSQFFFDNVIFYNFLKQCRAAGITTPIHPGLLPIHDYDAVQRFATKCGASIPAAVQASFSKTTTAASTQELASALLRQQIQDLIAHDTQHIHFYTMNKIGITLPIISEILKVR